MNENIEKESNKLLKQRLQRVHVATGISFSLLMYVAVFLEYLQFYFHIFKYGKSHQGIFKWQILQRLIITQ